MTDLELQNILARRNQAAALAQTQAPQGRMVGRHYINANPLEYLASALRARSGMKGMEQADTDMQALQTKREGMDKNAMSEFARLLRGEQAQEFPPITPMDDEGNVMPTARREATPANPQGAYSALMGAYNPAMQQAGMQGMLTDAKTQADAARKAQESTRIMGALQSAPSAQAAIAAGVPPEIVKQYYEAPNLGKVKGIEVNGQIVNPTTGETIGKPIPKQANPFSDLLVTDASGAIVPNTALLGAKKDIAAAGKPSFNITNRIENKASENIAGQVGGILKESATAAEGAVRTLDAASRIVNAVDSGKVIAGPLANARVSAAQAAQLLGVGGKDNAEVLANTRSTIRGLAEMTLQGRKQMSGQGAITESESKLAEKANSGDITDLTPAEIKQLAQASARVSQWMIKTHKARLDAAGKLPGVANLVPFFSAPELPSDMPNGFKVIP